MVHRAVPQQLNLVVTDMAATLAFYSRLRWDIAANPDDEHVEVPFGGVSIEFDSPTSVAAWSSAPLDPTGSSAVLGLHVPTREAVDELYADLVAHGHHGRQPPYDAFWGSRYAIVDDPDGRPVGLMSPRDEDRAVWPPTTPPPSAKG